MIQLEKRIKTVILGATGAVGQRFIQLLANHPWFEVAAVTASDRNTGKRYSEACRWHLDDEVPDGVANMVIQPTRPGMDAQLAFSALPADEALSVEPSFAAGGYVVCSNSSAFRLEPDVPLIIPEVNPGHLSLLEKQHNARGWAGLLVTSPNCTTTGITIPLKALDDAFGVTKVFAVSMQAVSGAGYPGLSYLEISDNVIPFISGEEEKIQRELGVLLGSMVGGERREAGLLVSAHANRVPVSDGHTICLSVAMDRSPSPEEAIRAMREYRGPCSTLPGMPDTPIAVSEALDRPQPHKDRGNGSGMQVTVGRVRSCPLLDIRMVVCVHNTLRGAASGSILNAELLVTEGLLKAS